MSRAGAVWGNAVRDEELADGEGKQLVRERGQVGVLYGQRCWARRVREGKGYSHCT